MIKLISINIEGTRHLERFIPFLQKEKPDVVCMQEVFESSMDRIKEALSMGGEFIPLADKRTFAAKNGLESGGIDGSAIFTHLPHTAVKAEFYNDKGELPVWTSPNSQKRAMLLTTVTKDNQNFTIATTHFTWDPMGGVNDEQREDLKRLLEIVKKYDNLILCGDFNAPRGGEIFGELSKHFKDNIPPEITTTIDQKLHKVKGLQLVVDGMFSKGSYSVKNVKVVGGVSDHQAIIAEVEDS
jgi:endonuclease/exonuclease/phosphatase family metal-dependent hydrolase